MVKSFYRETIPGKPYTIMVAQKLNLQSSVKVLFAKMLLRI